MTKLLTQSAIKPYLDDMKRLKVSERARQPDGFLGVYLKEGLVGLLKTYPEKNHNYLTERELFIKRHLPLFQSNPTYRRFLALVAWAYDPNK